MNEYCTKHGTQKNRCSQCICDKIDDLIKQLRALDAKVHPPEPEPKGWWKGMTIPLSRLRKYVTLR